MFNKSNIMRFSIILLSISTLAFIVMALIQLFGTTVDFKNWFVVILLIIFSVTQIICIVAQTFSLKKAGFYLLHIGLVAFLLGNFMYFLKGESFYSYLYVDKVTYSNIAAYPNTDYRESEMDVLNLEFSIGAYSHVKEMYEDNPSMLKNEEAVIISSEIKVSASSTIPGEILSPNNPLRLGKYKIYLMSSSPDGSIIYLQYKYDPGEFISTTGIIMIIIGSFLSAFMKSASANSSENSNSLKGGKK